MKEYFSSFLVRILSARWLFNYFLLNTVEPLVSKLRGWQKFWDDRTITFSLNFIYLNGDQASYQFIAIFKRFIYFPLDELSIFVNTSNFTFLGSFFFFFASNHPNLFPNLLTREGTSSLFSFAISVCIKLMSRKSPPPINETFMYHEIKYFTKTQLVFY